MIAITKIELRDVLAFLFPDKEDAQPVLDYSSVDKGWVDFSGSSKRMWDNILTVASEYDGAVTDILKNAMAEYKDEEIEGKQIILDALKYGVIFENKKSEKKDEEKKEVYVPFKNILKYINKDNFGEIRRVDCNRYEQVVQYSEPLDDNCKITYSIGTSKDKPNSFAERMMLQTLEDSKEIDSGEHNCWLYRMPNGDFRVDEIPFDIRPNLDLSKKLFCKRLESLFIGLNMDKAKEYFAHQNYKQFSISINFDYSMGHGILESFTAWLYDTFSGIKETNFQIFIILTGDQKVDKIISHINQIIKSQKTVSIIPIQVIEPISDEDIQKWKRKINLDSYTQDEFISDLKFLNVSEEEINEYKNMKKISMKVMEIFQDNLYEAFYKNS